MTTVHLTSPRLNRTMHYALTTPLSAQRAIDLISINAARTFALALPVLSFEFRDNEPTMNLTHSDTDFCADMNAMDHHRVLLTLIPNSDFEPATIERTIEFNYSETKPSADTGT